MNVLRVLPLRRALWVTAVVTAAAMVCGTWLLGNVLGRRADGRAGGLASTLQLASVQETRRLVREVEDRQREMDGVLAQLLQLGTRPVPENMPVPAAARACGKVTLPEGVSRAGVVALESSSVLVLVEMTDKGCTDRQWGLAYQALAGPAFPDPDEIQRVVQAAMLGMDHVEDGRMAVTAVFREGVFVVLRHARAEGGLAAFVDFKPGTLPRPPPVPGVRQDSFVTVGSVVAGYVHGGPGIGMIPAAVKRIKAGSDRALELPEVVEAAASRAVLAWLFPAESDDGDLALGGHDVVLPAALPWPVRVTTVTSVPWPTATTEGRLAWLAVFLVACVLELLALVLVTRRLAAALESMAGGVRASWVVDHAAERDPTDDERAERLLEALADGGQKVVTAAYGRSERYWAAAALARLVDLLRRAVRREPPRPGS